MNIGGWSLDQLMELAGLSVSQAGEPLQASIIKFKKSIILMHNGSLENAPTQSRKECPRCMRARKQWYALIQSSNGFSHSRTLIYPSLKGGDGLVAARHLAHYGYKPTVYYPKEGKNELYQVRPSRTQIDSHSHSIKPQATKTLTKFLYANSASKPNFTPSQSHSQMTSSPPSPSLTS